MMASDKNAEKRAVAQELVERGYKFGYATYWNANITQELSEGRVELANLHREDDGSLTLFRWSSMRRYYEEDYPSGEVFLLLTEQEEQALQQDGAMENSAPGNLLLQSGREDFRESGFVVYHYERNEDFLKALREAFP